MRINGRRLPIVEDQLKHLKQLNGRGQPTLRMPGSPMPAAGMGGSSLCPEVLKITYGKQPGQSGAATFWIQPIRRRFNPSKPG